LDVWPPLEGCRPSQPVEARVLIGNFGALRAYSNWEATAVAALEDSRAQSDTSERDGTCNISDGTNGTIAYEGPKASVGEVLGPKAAICYEVFVGLLHHGVSEPAVPFSPSCYGGLRED